MKDQAIVGLKILFQAVDSTGEAVVKRALFNNLLLSADDTEEQLAESVAQEISKNSPGTRILAGSLTYYINLGHTALYKTTSANETVEYRSSKIPISEPFIQGLYQVYPSYKKESEKAWRAEVSVSEPPLQNNSYMSKEKPLSPVGTLSKLTRGNNQVPTTVPNNSSLFEQHPATEETQRGHIVADSTPLHPTTTGSERVLQKPSSAEDSNNVEYVKTYLTGDEDSVCWPAYRDHFVVSETGSDQKICVIQGNCIHSDQRMRYGLTLACLFDPVKGTCPTATECLKDPHAKINVELYSSGPLSPPKM